MLPSMSGVINRPTVSVDEAIKTGLFSQLIAAERGESPGQEHRRDAIQA